eukprot:2262133-Rhodomonas_salina.1
MEERPDPMIGSPAKKAEVGLRVRLTHTVPRFVREMTEKSAFNKNRIGTIVKVHCAPLRDATEFESGTWCD